MIECLDIIREGAANLIEEAEGVHLHVFAQECPNLKPCDHSDRKLFYTSIYNHD